MEGLRYFDAHVHMSWYESPGDAMRECAGAGIGGICCTVDAGDFEVVGAGGDEVDGWHVAAGLHPWWAEGADLEAAVAHVEVASYVGEIGLDLGKKHAHTAESQLRAFTAICEAAREGAVLSIHSVAAADTVLDILEATGALKRCRPVLHWFSGTSSELDRARRAGCWFSFGERSLATRRGREYVRQAPAMRLLTETDLPERPGSPADTDAHLDSLQRAVVGIANVRGAEAEEARALLLQNARSIIC